MSLNRLKFSTFEFSGQGTKTKTTRITQHKRFKFKLNNLSYFIFSFYFFLYKFIMSIQTQVLKHKHIRTQSLNKKIFLQTIVKNHGIDVKKRRRKNVVLTSCASLTNYLFIRSEAKLNSL